MSLERVTRVSEALYRVTDLMPDEEPLKWSLRTKAIELVELLSFLTSSASLKDRAVTSARVHELIDAITRLLDIAAGASFISKVNFDVLRREYGLLRELPQPKETLLLPITMPQETEKVETPARHVVKGDLAISVSPETAPAVKTTPQPSRVEISAETPRAREVLMARPAPEKDNNRRSRILSYLGAHPWASRGDVAAIFGREISEKTLQRELSALVDSGAIIKEGEKRWCRYALKGQK